MYEVDGLKVRELSCTQGVVSQANIDISAPNTGVGSAFNFQIIGAIVVLTILISLFFIKNKNKIPKKVLFGFMMGVVSFGAICAPFNNVASAKSCVKEAGKYDIVIQFFKAKNVYSRESQGINWINPLLSSDKDFLTKLKEDLIKENIPIYTNEDIVNLSSVEMTKYELSVRRVAIKVALKVSVLGAANYTTDKIEPKDTDRQSKNYDLFNTKVIEGSGSTNTDWDNVFNYTYNTIFRKEVDPYYFFFDQNGNITTIPQSSFTNENGQEMTRYYVFTPFKKSFVAPEENQAQQIYKVYVSEEEATPSPFIASEALVN